MQEIFYEESSKIPNEKSEKFKYNLLLTVSILNFLGCFVWFFVCFYIYDVTVSSILVNIIIMVIPFLIFLTVGFLCFKFKNNYYIQYDYTFVSGSIRIDKVIKNVKRIQLYDFEYNQIDLIGRFASDTYFQVSSDPHANVEILTSDMQSVDLFYIVVTISGEKNILTLQCSKQFITHIVKFTGRTVLEKDFK